jgi:hypothetical protein
MQLIHILHFTINNVFYKLPPPQKNTKETYLENERAREWVPLFLSNNQETPCPERHKHNGRSEVMHYLTGRLPTGT